MNMNSHISSLLYKIFSVFRRDNDDKSKQAALENLLNFSEMITPEVFQVLETSENGLLYSDARERRREYGLNEVSYELPPTWYHLLFRSYINPFNILLTLLGIIYYFLGDSDGTIIIASMVGLSVGIRFYPGIALQFGGRKAKSHGQHESHGHSAGRRYFASGKV